MRIVLCLLIMLLSGITGGAVFADDNCPSGDFETDIEKITRSYGIPVPEWRRPGYPDDPVEITRIHNGAISFYAGAFINDGIIYWRAFDADRHLFVSVQGYAGPQLYNVPDAAHLTKRQFVRDAGSGRGKRVDVVTIVPATAKETHVFACLANHPFSGPKQEEPSFMTDTFDSDFHLMHNGIYREAHYLDATVGAFIDKHVDQDKYAASDIAVDNAGNLYVTNTCDVVHKITPMHKVTVLAGDPCQPGDADGVAEHAGFRNPRGIAIDRRGNLYVADSENETIRKIAIDGTVSTLAGMAGEKGFVDGNGAAARFNIPIGVAVDFSGNVYVADFGNNAIRKISPAGDVATLAGKPGKYEEVTDGTVRFARFDGPKGIAVDHSGNVYVTDFSGLRKITTDGWVLTRFESTRGIGNMLTTDDKGNILFVSKKGIEQLSPLGEPVVLSIKPVDAVQRKLSGLGDVRSMTVDRFHTIFVVNSYGVIQEITSDGNVHSLGAPIVGH